MKKYSIGLDIGTTSVGWACVNVETKKMIRKGNKNLWGVSLFDEAEPAAATRMFRSSRRRYDRRRKRIKLLQKEFKKEIDLIDNNFFIKLKESFYNEKDKDNKTIILTENEKKAIKEYNIKYPTIYHLRDDLMKNNEKMDIRLIYLAIHHIIKYRGNFLYDNNFNINKINIIEKFKEILEAFNNNSETITIQTDKIETFDYKELEAILKVQYKKDKEKLLTKHFESIFDKKIASTFAKAITGYKFEPAKLFNIDTDSKLSISLSGTDLDDKITDIEGIVGEMLETLDLIKQLYDMSFLSNLFKGKETTSISKLMVERYDKHKNDLKLIKELYRNNKKEFKAFFKDKDKTKCFYSLYINNKKDYSELKAILNKYLSTNDFYKKEYIIEELEKEEFLPRITNVDNGKYPFQLNKYELQKIIEIQGKYYPFLKEEINGKPKIIQLLEFRIPYYVGPLNKTTDNKDITNRNAWVVKKDEKKQITPYNFNEVIDVDETAIFFIERMISNCTYLLNEKAIPANSILYSKYKVLNELKQIKVNDMKLSQDFILKTIDNLFKKTSGNITNSVFEKYLRQTEEYSSIYNFVITGYSDDKKFANNLQTYYDFFNEKTGLFKNTNYLEKDAEIIIKYITIFEDKDILIRKIKQEFPLLSDQVIEIIKNKKYKGWSSLSEKLLTYKFYKDPTNNIFKSIMDLMVETNDNFMQILFNDKYKFQKFIEEENTISDNKELNYSVVEKLATSPATKKGIYHSLKVIKELIDYIGYEPESIILEMARADGEKKRTENRKNYLIKLYETNKKEIFNYNELMKELKGYEKIDNQKLYLYFIQEGRSLYSGKQLSIDSLNDYEIDHIIPRTLIKDDSIDNKALVLRSENQDKAASLVLPYEFRNQNNIIWWKSLKNRKLISNKKFYNLTRSSYSEDDIKGFINRQLVETRQITKHVSNIIKNFYNNTEVVYLNANVSHNYREKFNLPKYRDLNDYHHAQDAYLASVLGDYKLKYFKDTTSFESLKELTNKLIKEKKYKEFRYGYLVNSLDNEVSFDHNTGELLFDADEFNKCIYNTLHQNDIIVSRKTEIKTGAFYDQTIYGKNDSKINSGIPLKDNLNPKLYGAYSSMKPSYMSLVLYKGKRKIIGIPYLIDVKSLKNKEIKNQFIKKHLGLKDSEDFKIIKERIPFGTLIKFNGHLCRINGYSNAVQANEISNAIQFRLNKELQEKWKKTLNLIFNNKKDDKYLNYENDTIEIFNYICEEINSRYFQFKSIGCKLKENINIKEETLDDRLNILKQLFIMLKANPSNANLKNHKSKKFDDRVGRLSGKSITSGTLIFQSITGLKEYHISIDELKV